MPCWIVAALLWTFVALASYNTGVLTPRVGALACVVDESGAVAVVDEHGHIVRAARRLRGPGKDARPAHLSRGSSGGHGNGWPSTGFSSDSGRARRKERASQHRRVESAAGRAELEWRTLWNEGTDAVLDVPIGGVCEVLYGESADGVDIDGDHDDDGDEHGLGMAGVGDIDTG